MACILSASTVEMLNYILGYHKNTNYKHKHFYTVVESAVSNVITSKNLRN